MFRSRGIAGALRYYGTATLDLFRDLSPRRRKSRYGDIGYDFDHGVDTTWATVGLRTRLRELLSGGQYQASEPDLFHEMLRALPKPVDGFTFVDLGSGKGRALLMASNYPFRRVLGVELLSELNDIAVSNISTYRNPGQKCFNIESRVGDVRDLVFPSEPTVLYMFNPFLEHVLRAVLSNLRASLLKTPRDMYVIYHNPVGENIFRDRRWLCELTRTPQYAIYQANCE